MKVKREIFRKGSKTYYNASRFFPRHIRDEVTTLYAFVRIVDDYVDATPQQEKEFYDIKEQLATRWNGKASGNKLVDDFVSLAEEREFKKEWVDAFMHSMEFDLSGKVCITRKQTDEYIHGSAEVIGLFMARIMDLPEKSYTYAKKLGYSMQMINFIRDVNEDLELKRWYLPIKIGDMTLKGLSKEYFLEHQEEFSQFMRAHIQEYYRERKDALKGLKYIPRRVRIPIKVASNMYHWTAQQIEKNPMIVFEKKVKPSKTRITCNYFKTFVEEMVRGRK